LRNIRPVIDQALADAEIRLSEIDAIAVTTRPGLSGALLIGTQTAHALAWAANKPLIGVDHLVGHLLAVFLDFNGQNAAPPPQFPFIGLLASGGHTALYRVDGPTHASITELGGTRDDAAGEAYDKVAKLLGLGYPGGPIIDRLAGEGDASQVTLSKPMARKDSLEFSFSGLKTNVARWVSAHGVPQNDSTLRNLCAAFQHRVVEALIEKSLAAAREEGIDTIVLAGGVSANSALRTRGAQMCEEQGAVLVVPDLRACTDNAAMIAYAGSFPAKAGADDRGSLVISPRTVLPRKTRKGGGQRVQQPL
jgi:N6-L-threonylcarbamoyladenine synthase